MIRFKLVAENEKGGTTLGKTKVSIKAVITILLLVMIPVVSFLIVSELETIETPPDKMFVGEDAFPQGWVRTYFEIEKYPGPAINWTAVMSFSNNSSVESEEAMIRITSYNSTLVAHEEYLRSIGGTYMNMTRISLGNEGHFELWAGSEPNPAIAEYVFRENNILVIIVFSKYSPADQYQPSPYQPWMDEVARLQASMIR
jgi:hypothetical protein